LDDLAALGPPVAFRKVHRHGQLIASPPPGLSLAFCERIEEDSLSI
jgi:hypothetical protein